MGVHKKGGLVGGFDQLRAPNAPTISVSGGEGQVTVTITNPSDTGGGDITSYAVSALTGPIENTTFAVTVVSDSGNKYAIDGTTQGTVTLHKGHTYIFDQSDSSNSGHPLRLSTTSNGSHGGGSEYTTGVTTSGSPGSAGAFTKIAVDSGAASTLYYYCSSHSGMGGTANVKTSLQGGASGSSSPITVSSLTNGESYNVRASAINAFGQSPYSAASTGSPAATRGYILSGYGTLSGSLATHNIIQVVTIASAGNSTDWGADLLDGRYSGDACSNSTTGIIGGGGNTDTTVDKTVIQYLNLTSAANAQDFGDLTTGGLDIGACSNSTYGFFVGGLLNSSRVNTIQRITIASTGNASDFGDLTETSADHSSFSDGTYGFRAGGTNGSSNLNTIDRFAMASSGNASDYGDLTVARNDTGEESNCCSSTRAIIAGGSDGSSPYSGVIDYVTMSSNAGATDFGDLRGNYARLFGTASTVRAIFGGGAWDGSGVNSTDKLDYVTIASTGNATSFGDLLMAHSYTGGAVSNGHGGLS